MSIECVCVCVCVCEWVYMRPTHVRLRYKQMFLYFCTLCLSATNVPPLCRILTFCFMTDVNKLENMYSLRNCSGVFTPFVSLFLGS
jgi:hypothetical protein